MTVLLETISLPESGLLDIEVKLQANILVTAAMARCQVNVFVTHNIGDLLFGEIPGLVWRENGAYWRVPVVLSSPSKGQIGMVGVIDV